MDDRLHFGRRARRRARRQRAVRVAAFASMAAAALGVPGIDLGLAPLDFEGGDENVSRASMGGVEATESAASSLRFRRRVFAVRPTPTPTSPPSEGEAPPETQQQAATGGTITEIIAASANEFGLSTDYLIAVADCESGLDPNAVNAVGYYGLFQFDETTWAAYGYGSIYDPVAQARTAARLIAAGQASRWPNCA